MNLDIQNEDTSLPIATSSLPQHPFIFSSSNLSSIAFPFNASTPSLEFALNFSNSIPKIFKGNPLNIGLPIEEFPQDKEYLEEYKILENETYEWSFNISLLDQNGTANQTATGIEYNYLTIFTALFLAVMILTTVIGNVFVIAAILLERNLQSVANYLILSLAVTDLLVAALVMPLSAVYEVSKEWTLGAEICDMWTACDVLCCTASILHLVAIALDRYWAVTNVDYIQHRSPKRVGWMIVIVWGVSFLISAAPMMGWKDPDWHSRVHEKKMCLVSQDLYYQIFATLTSFYLPLSVILILYHRIYQAARKRIRRKRNVSTAQANLCKSAVAISETTTFTRVSSTNDSPEKSSNGTVADNPPDDRTSEETFRLRMSALPLNPLALLAQRPPRKKEQEARRERKAAKTLAVITGAFVMCWLPFFVLALVMPLCGEACKFSPYLIAAFLWLGYLNSTLNPIIYTIFSPDFRHAFRRILCGKKRARRRHNESRMSSVRTGRT